MNLYHSIVFFISNYLFLGISQLSHNNFLSNFMADGAIALTVPIDRTNLPLMLMFDPPSPDACELQNILILGC